MGQAEPAVEREAALGVMFVHGIGSRQQGRTLETGAGPLFDFASNPTLLLPRLITERSRSVSRSNNGVGRQTYAGTPSKSTRSSGRTADTLVTYSQRICA